MVKVSIEVRSGAARFAVAVSALNARRALGIAQGRYSGGDRPVRFPFDPEGFFETGPAARAGSTAECGRPAAAVAA